MTEIVNNKNSIAFDLLDTGNNGSNSLEGNDFFNTLFGDIETESVAEIELTDTDTNEIVKSENIIQDVLNMLKDGNLNLPEDILDSIKNRLKELFKKINIGSDVIGNTKSTELNNNANENYLHLMTFLEELRGLIKTKYKVGDVDRDVDLVLDKVRSKLNEQIKNFLEKKITPQHVNKNDSKLAPQKPKNVTSDDTRTFHNAKTSSITQASSREHSQTQFSKPSIDSLVNSKGSMNQGKKNLQKPKSLNGLDHLEEKKEASGNINKKSTEPKIDVSNQTSTNTKITKDLNSDSSPIKQPIHLTSKLDVNSSSGPTSSQKPSVFHQENNDKSLHTLNMLSKSWGNKLIGKIEKSITDGIEQLEISLTPKSLGRLNVTIHLQDTIAKINIVAESAGAAALLGEAEAKLSHMMELSGLKLGSLQTLTQQSGNNQKGKEKPHKLASTVKKSNIDENIKSQEKIAYTGNKSEGLNLIA